MNPQRLSRRDFLRLAGLAAGAAALGACRPALTPTPTPAPTNPPPADQTTRLPPIIPREDVDVAIIGAGIAGLSAAHFLMQENAQLAVLEASDSAGGRTVSGKHDQFVYAKGTAFLDEPDRSLEKILRTLGLESVEVASPGLAGYYKDQFFYGAEGLALLYIRYGGLYEYNRFLEAVQNAYRLYDDAASFNPASSLAALDSITARRWFQQQGFPAIYASSFDVLARSLFGAGLDEISALSFLPEIAFAYQGAEKIEDVNTLSNSSKQGADSTGMFTFTYGVSQVISALVRQVGDRLRLQSTVLEVAPFNTGYRITYAEPNGDRKALAAARVILAVPAHIARQIAPHALDEERRGLLEQVVYSPYITAALFSQQPIFDRAFNLVLEDGHFVTSFYDSTWVQRHLDPTARDKSATVLSAYIAPASIQDTSLLALSNSQLLERIFATLEQLFPGSSGQVTGADIQRFRYAHPVMVPGAYERLARLYQVNRGGLLLAGDYTIFPSFESAAESGYQAAIRAFE